MKFREILELDVIATHNPLNDTYWWGLELIMFGPDLPDPFEFDGPDENRDYNFGRDILRTYKYPIEIKDYFSDHNDQGGSFKCLFIGGTPVVLWNTADSWDSYDPARYVLHAELYGQFLQFVKDSFPQDEEDKSYQLWSLDDEFPQLSESRDIFVEDNKLKVGYIRS